MRAPVISPWKPSPLKTDASPIAVADAFIEAPAPAHRGWGCALLAASLLVGGCAALPMPATASVVTQVAPSLLSSAQSAKQSIWLATPSLQDPKLIAALQQAHAHGVEVNVVLTRSTANLGAALRFSDPLNGVPFRYADAPLTHTLAIIDGTTAFTEQGPQDAGDATIQFIDQWQHHAHAENVVRPPDTWSLHP